MSANNVCGDQSTSAAPQSFPVAHLLSHGTSYRTPSFVLGWMLGRFSSSSAAVQQQCCRRQPAPMHELVRLSRKPIRRVTAVWVVGKLRPAATTTRIGLIGDASFISAHFS